MLASLLLGLAAAPPQQAVEAELFVSGLNSPLFVCGEPGGDSARVFVITKGGQVVLVVNGVSLATPFLDISARLSAGGEGGLLGMAFHPDYQSNGYFFLNYTNAAGHTQIERYQTDPLDRNRALPGSDFGILRVQQPFSNHNGGWLGFGADGYLYVPLGDGGSVGDPGNRAQNGQELLGKILRIDVDGGTPYAIPPDNPFVGDPNVRDEIYAIGMRNPWRCDFDSLTGDLWIGDVGQTAWESVDLLPAGRGGLNFGWRIMEGNHCYNPAVGCNTAGLTLPVYEYAHGGTPYRCSVIGGIVYRGREMATMHGRFFFSDYCSGETWSVRRQGGSLADFTDHSAELDFNTIVSMGRDSDGEAYFCADLNVYKMVPAGLRVQVPRLTAGSAVTARVTGGAPLTTTSLYFSRQGLGSKWEPIGNVRLEIAAPRLVGVRLSDAAGEADFPASIPPNLQQRTIWIQAAQPGQGSNVIVTTVR